MSLVAPASDPNAAPRSRAAAARRGLILLIAGLWVAAQLWATRGYVPIWDARVYADCVVLGAQQPFALEALRCADHPSHAYVAVLALAQRLSPGSMPLFLAPNAALLVAGGVALARLLRRAFPAPELATERALVVAALLVDPVVVSGMVHINVDFGVMVFLLCATSALVEGRPWMAAGFGLLTAFTKETGALLYGGLLIAWWLSISLPRPVPRDARNAIVGGLIGFSASIVLLPWGVWSAPVAAAVALVVARGAYGGAFDGPAVQQSIGKGVRLAPLAAPLLVYATYLVVRPMLLPQAPVLWGEATHGMVLHFLLYPQLSAGVRDYLALIFVVNFHWIIGAVIALEAMRGALRQVRWERAVPVDGVARDLVRFVALLAAVEAYLITRIQTAVIARYMVPMYPIVLALFLASLIRLRASVRVRRTILGALPVLLALSTWRTIDPVSKGLWGTFAFGRHGILDVKSIVPPYGGPFGPDEAVYNLEFLTAAAQVSQRVLDRVRPAEGGVVVTARLGDWRLFGPIDAQSQRRLAGPRLVEPRVLDAERLATAAEPADRAWFVEVPYAANDSALRLLAPRYDVGAPDTVWYDGYGFALRRLTRRVEHDGAH